MQLIITIVFVTFSWAAIPDEGSQLDPMKTEIPPYAKALTGAALVEYVKNNQQLFKINSEAPTDELRTKVMKQKFGIQKKRAPVENTSEDDRLEIPESFDARSQWSYCPSLSYIRDQSDCGSCWAVSSAEAMSDRVCIASNGKKNIELSADDILTCCSDCGNGCLGGRPLDALIYFIETGIVTGGRYGTKNVCKSYEISPCGIHRNETFYRNCTGVETPKCERKCQPGYSNSYNKDKSYGKDAYTLSSVVSDIQKEIIVYGPVVAVFEVFDDFLHYESGVYEHTAGGLAGSHAVRVLGWGVENGTPYWLAANSWNTDWGEKGYFRIRRGTNECGFEESMVAGRA